MNTVERQQQSAQSKVAVRKQVEVITDRIAEWLLASLKYMKIEPKTIADLGCGTGIMINKLRTIYPDTSYIAIDQSKDVLHSIQLTDSDTVLCSDCTAIDLADNSCDMVISNMMLHACNDMAGCFREVRRILKPQGLWIFSTYGVDTLAALSASHVDHCHDLPLNVMDMHDIGDLLIQSHFLEPVMECDYLHLEYETMPHMLSDLVALGIQDQSCLDNQDESFMQQLTQQYLAKTQQSKLIASFEIILGHAWLSQDKQFTSENGDVMIPLDNLRR